MTTTLSAALVILLLTSCAVALTDVQVAALKYMKLDIVEKKHIYRIKVSGLPNHAYGAFTDEKTGETKTVETNVRRYKIPKHPQTNEVPKCLNSGPIGVAVNGVPFYHPYNKRGYDAGNHVITDSCGGHIDHKGRYHYHTIPYCLFNPNATDQFMGVAMDGYPIYGPIDENGEMIRSADLDVCHGRLENGRYTYRLTFDFPYILGCYQGRTLTKTSGHCLIAIQRNPGLSGRWTKKKEEVDEKDEKQKMPREKKQHDEGIDVNSEKFARMRKRIIKLLLKRNQNK